MAIRDLPDMYVLSPRAACMPEARGLQAYISGKSPMPMLQLLHKPINDLYICTYNMYISKCPILICMQK